MALGGNISCSPRQEGAGRVGIITLQVSWQSAVAMGDGDHSFFFQEESVRLTIQLITDVLIELIAFLKNCIRLIFF